MAFLLMNNINYSYKSRSRMNSTQMSIFELKLIGLFNNTIHYKDKYSCKRSHEPKDLTLSRLSLF
jgi:hypothetical protein